MCKNSYIDVHLLEHGNTLEGILESNILGGRDDNDT